LHVGTAHRPHMLPRRDALGRHLADQQWLGDAARASTGETTAVGTNAPPPVAATTTLSRVTICTPPSPSLCATHSRRVPWMVRGPTATAGGRPRHQPSVTRCAGIQHDAHGLCSPADGRVDPLGAARGWVDLPGGAACRVSDGARVLPSSSVHQARAGAVRPNVDFAHSSVSITAARRRRTARAASPPPARPARRRTIGWRSRHAAGIIAGTT